MKPEVLYISYDGILEPLGRSQVLAYLKKLSATYAVSLVSFEKAGDWADRARRDPLIDEVRAAGILWSPLQYHRRPTLPATAYDIIIGIAVCAGLVLRRRIRLVHARSYVASTIALALKRVFGVRFLFDMRGFWADEKVESGAWAKKTFLYGLAKGFERRFLSEADAIVSLTHAGVDELSRFAYPRPHSQMIEVIPTCTDLELFSLPACPRPAGRFIVGCVGSVRLWYMFDEMVAFFKALQEQRPDARLVVLNRDEHEYVRRTIMSAGVSESCWELRGVEPRDIPREMSAMDAGLFFIRPVFSKRGSCPTKMGEFLASGVPCVGNAGVGDCEQLLEGARVGVALKSFDETALRAGARRLLELSRETSIRGRCIETARAHFSLDRGVASIERIYEALLA